MQTTTKHLIILNPPTDKDVELEIRTLVAFKKITVKHLDPFYGIDDLQPNEDTEIIQNWAFGEGQVHEQLLLKLDTFKDACDELASQKYAEKINEFITRQTQFFKY